VRQTRPRSRVIRRAALTCLVLSALAGLASTARAQQRPPARDSLNALRPRRVSTDSTRDVSTAPTRESHFTATAHDSLLLAPLPIFGLFGEGHAFNSLPSAAVDAAIRTAQAQRKQALLALWRAHAVGGDLATTAETQQMRTAQRSLLARAPIAPAKDATPPTLDLFDAFPDLNFKLDARLESRVERDRNERCSALQATLLSGNCKGAWSPAFDFNFAALSSGTVASRVHVDLDFNTNNERDASNNISVRYDGRKDEIIQQVEVGNITFTPPSSRFISSGIPSGNYGVQAKGQLGPMLFTTLFAQQKGNLNRERAFTVGDRAEQQDSRVIEDVGMEPRRFFLTVNPKKLPGYPNIDILNRAQMQRVAASLPDSLRPTRIYLYRQLIGELNPNPRGPQFSVRGARNSSRQLYKVLRENVDYYVDPSQLWIALTIPLSEKERLAVAYEVKVNGVPGRNPNTGGTPDIEFSSAPQFANLLWEPELQPSDTGGYFQREVKSVYRLGGDKISRASIDLKIVTGTSGDQERPQDISRGATYLQLFGLSQATNPATVDVENHVWPRAQDANRLAGTVNDKIIRDNYIVFPSLQPFARAGLAQPFANPANDTLYSYPNEYLYSRQRPPSIFRILTSFLDEGGNASNALELGSNQVRVRSERVYLDGQQLIRDIDYTVSYEIGLITFNRPDTLFLRPRQVLVRFQEDQPFNSTPTSIFALSTQFPTQNGQVSFTAISQQQATSYNRPPLGFEAQGSLVAGVTANFSWDATAITHALSKLPIAPSVSASRIGMTGEFAVSRPQPNSVGMAYIESFEDDAGNRPSLSDEKWALSSRPAAGTRLASLFGSNPLTLARNSTLIYQSVISDQNGAQLQFTLDQIDPSVKFAGDGVLPPETLLWLTLNPLKIGGYPGVAPGTPNRRNAWTIGQSSLLGTTPTGRRWGSLQYVLDPNGIDLSATENIEFFALVHTDVAKRKKNPTIVLDFGDISENRVAFAPETLTVTPTAGSTARPDTTFRGKRLVGYDRLDSERDKFSRAFNAVDNDVGIAGSIADSIIVVDRVKGTAPFLAEKVALCSAVTRSLLIIGDNRANCSAHNNRLDEEDIDLDGQLNLKDSETDREQWKRFAVDLSDDSTWSRVGKCRGVVIDSATTAGAQPDTLCWVQVRLNWHAPLDSLNAPNDRCVRAMRVTMVSAAGVTDDEYSHLAIARFNLAGAPWLRRGDRPLAGIAGDSSGFTNGYVISSLIGTQDTSATLHYQPPPGVAEQVTNKSQTALATSRVQVNEHSLRLQAGVKGGQFPVFNRAEAYLRFPEGSKTFMGYRTLRVWMRGRGNGWGANGELNAYIKVGRDENNFYLYRTTAESGETVAAWEPEVRVDLTRFQALRAQLENNSLQRGADSLACTGADLEMIRRSGLPHGVTVRRFAVCNNGYIVYTADPGVTPPNLAGIQEMAVGFVRVDSVSRGITPIMPNDSLELWVDEIRLSDVVDDIGFAGEIGLFGNVGDVADFHINLSRRDPNFRQLGENPTFLTTNGISVGTTVHVDRFLPHALGLAMPLSIVYNGTGIQQQFINQTDVLAEGIQGLRNPHDARVDYALSIRRADPVVGGWYAGVVNGLALSAAWGHGNGQSTYQQSRNNNYSFNAILNLDGSSGGGAVGSARLPAIIDHLLGDLPSFLRESESIKGLRAQKLRWRPSHFLLTSGLIQDSYSTMSFLKPAYSPTDTGAFAQSLSHLWQNSSTLEFRPIKALSASFNARQIFDLRDYGNSTVLPDSVNRALAASAERVRVLGADVGLERERSVNSILDFRPGITDWLQPTLRFGGFFSLYKDPNASALLRTSDSSEYRLPKRVGAMQNLDASLVFDPGRLVAKGARANSRLLRFGHAIQPLVLSWSRSISSNYDYTSLTPGVAYQFGLGGISAFRGLDGQLSTGAARVSSFSANGAFSLPFSFTIRSSVQRGDAENWTRRSVDNVQSLITGDNSSYPDVSAEWSWKPRKPNPFFSALVLKSGYKITESSTLAMSETGAIAQQSSMHYWEQPLSGSVDWAFIRGLSTFALYSRSTNEDQLPGSITRYHPVTQSYKISLPFRLPADWNTQTPLHVTVEYTSVDNVRIVEDAPGTTALLLVTTNSSVLANAGRQQYSFNAVTDLSSTTSFSITGSHLTLFDRNYNRRTSQSILSTVLQLKFGSAQQR
jgi:hypothetical protein